MVTDAQVRRLREKRMSGKTVTAAAAAAGMSERTARRWRDGALPTATAPRTWLVADTEGRLQALTVFRELCRRHPGRFEPGQLRTLQRRVREWRAQDGLDREVCFEQVAVPGREARSTSRTRAIERPAAFDAGEVEVCDAVLSGRSGREGLALTRAAEQVVSHHPARSVPACAGLRQAQGDGTRGDGAAAVPPSRVTLEHRNVVGTLILVPLRRRSRWIQSEPRSPRLMGAVGGSTTAAPGAFGEVS